MSQFFFTNYESEQRQINELIDRNPISFPDKPDPESFVPFSNNEKDDINIMIDTLAEAHGQSVRTIETSYKRLDFYKYVCRKNIESAKEKYLYKKNSKS